MLPYFIQRALPTANYVSYLVMSQTTNYATQLREAVMFSLTTQPISLAKAKDELIAQHSDEKNAIEQAYITVQSELVQAHHFDDEEQ